MEEVFFSNNRANETSNVLQLLNYTKEYANSISTDQFYYPDTSSDPNPRPFNTGNALTVVVGTAADQTPRPFFNAVNDDYNEGYAKRLVLTGAANENKVSIPLNIYSYFATFKKHLHPNIKTKISIKLEDDDNIIYRHNGAPRSKVLVTKLRLWIPLITFHGNVMQSLLEKYLSPQKWIFLKEYTETQTTTATNSYFRISTALRRPRHIFIWAKQTDNYNNQENNIFTFDTFAIGGNNRYFSKTQIEINNSIYYPQLEYNGEDECRLYRALRSYNSAYNDYMWNSLINRSNFKKLFGIIYFDLRHQDIDIRNASSVNLTFRYELHGDSNTQYTITALFYMNLKLSCSQVRENYLLNHK